MPKRTVLHRQLPQADAVLTKEIHQATRPTGRIGIVIIQRQQGFIVVVQDDGRGVMGERGQQVAGQLVADGIGDHHALDDFRDGTDAEQGDPTRIVRRPVGNIHGQWKERDRHGRIARQLLGKGHIGGEGHKAILPALLILGLHAYVIDLSRHSIGEIESLAPAARHGFVSAYGTYHNRVEIGKSGVQSHV